MFVLRCRFGWPVVLAGPVAPGGGVEVPGGGDAGVPSGFGVCVPGDAQPAAGAAAGGELPVLDPVVDDAGAAAEPPGSLADADLPAAVGGRARDVVGVPDPLDGLDVERAAGAGAVSVLAEDGDQAGVAGDGAEPADQVGGRGGGRTREPGGLGPVEEHLVGAAGR